MGGGVDADLIARAIIAAARAYGDDPVLAVTSKRGHVRRALAAAAQGLCAGADVTVTRAATLVDINYRTLTKARGLSEPGFQAAALAAANAVREALAGNAFSPAHPAVRRHERQAYPRPGPISAPLHPSAVLAAPIETPSTLEARIIARLDVCARTPMSLASELGVKELNLSQVLSLLRHQGQVVADEMGDEGPRYQLWRLKPGDAA